MLIFCNVRLHRVNLYGKEKKLENIALSCVANNQNKLTFTVCVPVFFLKSSALVLQFCLNLHIYFNFLAIINFFYFATLLTKIRGCFYFFLFFPYKPYKNIYYTKLPYYVLIFYMYSHIEYGMPVHKSSKKINIQFS